MRFAERKRELDPLAVLQEGSLEGGKEGGQMNMFKLVPNFEMTMYLAQATGAYIVTDSPFRWSEVKRAIRRRVTMAKSPCGIWGSWTTSSRGWDWIDEVETR